MASTSTSLGVDDILSELQERVDSPLNPKYTIFLSHCGEQKAFVEQLYEDLKSRGLSPFFDQCPKSLPKGEVFADRIFEAAKECVVAVVVLSKEFLESKWAMLELETFVEAQKTLNPKLKLFPLFYKLEASDLKEANMTKIMAQWTEMADADDRIHPNVWKSAIKVLVRANGEVFSRYGGSEFRYRKAIVDAVCKLCRRYVETRVPSMVGRDRLCNILEGEFERLATKRGVLGARMLGLYGMGGLGKTVICKALCDHFSDEYSGRVCYVECSDGVYLEVLKSILEELTDIDERALQNISNEKQANDSLKRFLPRQDVFLVLDNVQDDHLDLPHLTYLSAKSKVVVTSRSLVNVQRVVDSQALCLPCPTLTEPVALQLFVRSTGCTQTLVMWTNKETETLKNCIELSLFHNDFDSLSDSHSSEKRGHYNPLVLVALGTSITENDGLNPMQLMEKCQLIKFLQHHERRALSDILRTREHALTAEENLLFVDVALFYPIKNLGDVEFVDVLDRLLKWLEIVDGSPRKEILHKLGRLKDLNDSALTDHRKVHELFPNIYLVLGREGMNRQELVDWNGSIQCLNKAFEILIHQEVSFEGVPLGVDPGKLHGNLYMLRGMARMHTLDYKGAAEDLQKANDFCPNHPLILQHLGLMRAMLMHYQEALETLNHAIALYPTTEEGINNAGWSYATAFAMRGIVKLELNDLIGGKLDIEFARALDPHNTYICSLDRNYKHRR